MKKHQQGKKKGKQKEKQQQQQQQEQQQQQSELRDAQKANLTPPTWLDTHKTSSKGLHKFLRRQKNTKRNLNAKNEQTKDRRC